MTVYDGVNEHFTVKQAWFGCVSTTFLQHFPVCQEKRVAIFVKLGARVIHNGTADSTIELKLGVITGANDGISPLHPNKPLHDLECHAADLCLQQDFSLAFV
jgi:hypothetical protein